MQGEEGMAQATADLRYSFSSSYVTIGFTPRFWSESK